MSKETRQRMREEAHDLMESLHKAGGIDLATLKEFEATYLSEIKTLSSSKIKALRREAGVSQPVLAKIMNVSAAAVKQWERGERKPSGASLKLLNLIDQNGIDAVM